MDKFHIALENWAKEAEAEANAHGRAARRLHRLYYSLGIPTSIVTAVVATAVFASLTSSVAPWAKILVGSVSLVTAILSALQTFLRLEPLAEQHRQAEAAYKALHRDVKRLIIFPPDTATAETQLVELSKRWQELDSKAPDLVTHHYPSLNRGEAARRKVTHDTQEK